MNVIALTAHKVEDQISLEDGEALLTPNLVRKIAPDTRNVIQTWIGNQGFNANHCAGLALSLDGTVHLAIIQYDNEGRLVFPDGEMHVTAWVRTDDPMPEYLAEVIRRACNCTMVKLLRQRIPRPR